MRWIALAACAGCSFFAVHGPETTTKPADCTDSDLVPSLDSVAGVLLVAGAVGGEIADRLASHPVSHYELVIGLPALAAGITYLISASRGTGAVERCRSAKDNSGVPRDCDGCTWTVP
ncbi:MAG TPA: hypothetical protein VGF94_30380 [Kofleriaceae bacterium]|jgi:hypothetical protein